MTPPGAGGAHLTVIGGLPGVGKTTLGAALAAHDRAALIDSDTLMGPLVAAALTAAGHAPQDYASELFQRHLKAAGYQAALDVTLEVLATGVSVVLVAPFAAAAGEGRGWWDDLSVRAASFGAHVELLWVVADREVHRRRLEARRAGRDSRRVDERFDTWWEAQHHEVPEYARAVIADLPVGELVALLRRS